MPQTARKPPNGRVSPSLATKILQPVDLRSDVVLKDYRLGGLLRSQWLSETLFVAKSMNPVINRCKSPHSPSERGTRLKQPLKFLRT